jgi:uncharacterized protein YutE (UPF0331/DUF86 family)
VTPGEISSKVVTAKLEIINRMRSGIQQLPLESLETFLTDPRNPAAGESYLRRMLEALMDLGRHVLARGFGVATAEYSTIADRLSEVGILTAEAATLLRLMARYRNRMVHFYDEVGSEELYEILTTRLVEVERVVDQIRLWIAEHPNQVDDAL